MDGESGRSRAKTNLRSCRKRRNRVATVRFGSGFDVVFVWLVCHGLEEAFECLVQKAVDSPEKFAVMNEKAIEGREGRKFCFVELAIGAEAKRRMKNSMRTIVDEVLKGETNPMVRSGCMFMWEQ